MYDVIDVDVIGLHGAAARIEAAGQALAGLAAPTAGALSGALERTSDAWIGYLAAVGSAIASTGADLHAVAETYARAEQAVRDELPGW